MTEENLNNTSPEGTLRRRPEEYVQELMKKFNVSEEEINVAINIVGRQVKKIEEYLEHNRSSRLYNIW